MYFSGRNLPAFVSAVSNIVSDKYLYIPNCGNEPTKQGTTKLRELRQPDGTQGGRLDERPLSGTPNRESLVLQLAIGPGHGVRVNRQRSDHILYRRKLIACFERSKPDCLFDLLDELQIGRHAGGGVQRELDCRHPHVFSRGFTADIIIPFF